MKKKKKSTQLQLRDRLQAQDSEIALAERWLARDTPVAKRFHSEFEERAAKARKRKQTLVGIAERRVAKGDRKMGRIMRRLGYL